MKNYTGHKDRDSWAVFVDGSPLSTDRAQKIGRSDVAGFAWGYQGSGPNLLALAILADHFQDDFDSPRLYQLEFMRRVIARLPQDQPWTLSSVEIDVACGL